MFQPILKSRVSVRQFIPRNSTSILTSYIFYTISIALISTHDPDTNVVDIFTISSYYPKPKPLISTNIYVSELTNRLYLYVST